MPNLSQTSTLPSSVEHETLFRSSLARSRDDGSPLVGHCPSEPPDPATGSYCWKFQHLDPTSPVDFWLLLSFRPGPKNTWVGSLVVPRDGGGLMHCIKTPVLHDAFKSRYVRVMKSSAGGFGPVSVAKMKVRIAYEETRQQIFGTEFLAARYDDELRLVEPYREVSSEAFPPLPRIPGPASGTPERGTRLAAWHRVDVVDAEPLGGLRFHLGSDPDVSDRELEVEGGETVEPTSAETIFDGTRPPGLYLDLAQRDSLSLATYSLVPTEGNARILFVDYCTGMDRDFFFERIIVKKSSSWFREKKKIIIIRKELRESHVTCGVLYDGPEVES